MIRTMLTVATALVAFTTMAFAADLPSKEKDPEFEPPPPMPVFSWTGAYFGVHAGYGLGHDMSTLRTLASGGYSASNPNGVLGGLHGGVNYSVLPVGRATLVTGVEADIDGADYNHTGLMSAPTLGIAAEVRSDIKGSVRARLGVADQRLLYYATGGVTFADFETRYAGVPALGAGGSLSAERIRPGYALGGGVEYAFLNYLTVRAEYRYSDYGSFVDPLGTAAPGVGATVSRRESDNRLQAGLSYKFNEILPRPASRGY